MLPPLMFERAQQGLDVALGDLQCSTSSSCFTSPSLHGRLIAGGFMRVVVFHAYRKDVLEIHGTKL